jgi:hypothetical protein
MKVEPIGAEALRGTNEAPKAGPRFTDKDRREELSRTINERNILFPGLIRQNRMTHAESERRQGILQELFVELDAKIRSGEATQAQHVAEESEAEQQAQGGQSSSPLDPITVTGAVETGGKGAPAESISPPQAQETAQNVSVEPAPLDRDHEERHKSDGERAG